MESSAGPRRPPSPPDGDDGNHENGYGAARPVLFTFTGNKWKKYIAPDTTIGAMKRTGVSRFGGR